MKYEYVTPIEFVNGEAHIIGKQRTVATFDDDLRIAIHDQSKCAGRHCVIHDPSNHHMRNLPLVWNSMYRRTERICSCGARHPDPDHIEYVRITKGDTAAAQAATHVCCSRSCCVVKKPRSKKKVVPVDHITRVFSRGPSR